MPKESKIPYFMTDDYQLLQNISVVAAKAEGSKHWNVTGTDFDDPAFDWDCVASLSYRINTKECDPASYLIHWTPHDRPTTTFIEPLCPKCFFKFMLMMAYRRRFVSEKEAELKDLSRG